ncbi:unnamed protein product [Closterium sp. NIES-53]
MILVGSAATARARVVAVAAGVVVVGEVEVVEVAEVVTVVGVVAGVGAAVVAAVGVGVMVVAAVEEVEAALVALGVELLRGEVMAVARGRSSNVWGSGVDIFALDYDAILAAIYALSVSAEGDYYQYVPPDPSIEAATLGASESALPGTVPAEALHTFTLDSGASRCFLRDSTTLTPLTAPVPVRLADPSGGPVLARSSTSLPCPAVPSSSLCGLHLPSFSTNLVSTAALKDAMTPYLVSNTVLYVDNKAMIALCREHRLDHRTKHIALRYFLARELHQRGQLRLAYVATRANTADVFTKALPPGDHQRFVTVLGVVPTLPHLLTA